MRAARSEKALNYQQALVIHREVGDRSGEGTTLNNIGTIYDNLGQQDEALDTYQQALAIRREVGDRYGEGVTYGTWAIYSSGWVDWQKPKRSCRTPSLRCGNVAARRPMTRRCGSIGCGRGWPQVPDEACRVMPECFCRASRVTADNHAH